MIVTRPLIAECLGLAEPSIARLVKDGMLKEARGKYDVAKCLRWYLDYKLKSGSSTSDVNVARKKLYIEQATKTRLENARTRRETIPADDHRTDLYALGEIFDRHLPLLVDADFLADLAAIGSGGAPVAHRITEQVHTIREHVANDIQAYAQGLKATD